MLRGLLLRSLLGLMLASGALDAAQKPPNLTASFAPTAGLAQEGTPARGDRLTISTATTPDVLVEALIGRIYKLNPLLDTYNSVDRDIVSLVFEGLTTTNDYGEIIPLLAESWTVSKDGLEYIVALRSDVLWQDGVPFTGEDVVFTFGLLADPQFPGAASLHEFWRTVEVDALSDQIVRFRLTQPLASFADYLRIGIVPAHVLRGMNVAELGTHPFNLAPIGTGPYQVEALTASNGEIDGVQLRIAPVYRQRPEGAEGYRLDRIVFRTYPTVEAALDAYRQGEVNSISTISYQQQTAAGQIPSLSLYTAVAPQVGVVIYNWERDPIRFVRNPRVRLALAQAVNRSQLVAQHLAGRAIVADSPLLPGSWAYEPGDAWPEYDLTQAQTLFDAASPSFETVSAPAEGETMPATEETVPVAPTEEAAAPEGEENPPPPESTEEAASVAPIVMRLNILTLDDPALVALATDIAAGWQQLGLSSSVEAVDTATLQARLEQGDFDAALIELSFESSADPDPFVFWHQGQYGSGQNYGGMDDRRISEALEMARRDAFGLHRIEYYHRFQQLFAERVPALVLYYPLYTYAADTRLAGVQLGFLSSPSDRFRHIRDWYFAD